MDRQRIDKEIEKEKNSAPEGCTPSETRETGTDGARGEAAAGGSLCLRIG